MTFGVADDPADCGTTEGADACAFFPRCQGPTSAAGNDNRGQTKATIQVEKLCFFAFLVLMFSSFWFLNARIWIASRATRNASDPEGG